MDSDEDAPPPPPPSSPPPGRDENEVTVSMSDKFKALQEMLISVPTMYSPANSKGQPSDGAAPPPSKRLHRELENEGDLRCAEVSKLKHTTTDRPRRKVRPPSRKDKPFRHNDEPKIKHNIEGTGQVKEVPSDLPSSDIPPDIPVPHLIEDRSMPPELYPPLSEENPPDLLLPQDMPPDLPPTITEEAPPDIPSHMPIAELFPPPLTEEMLPDLPPPPPLSSDFPLGKSSKTNTNIIIPASIHSLTQPLLINIPADYTVDVEDPYSATTYSLKTKPLPASPKWNEDSCSVDQEAAARILKGIKQVAATPPLQSALSSSPTSTGSLQSKGIVMGSFSERLKKIRENRSSRRSSPSLKASTSLTSNTEKSLSTRQTDISDFTATPSHLTSLTTSPALSVHSSSSNFSYSGDLTPSTSNLMQPTNNFDEKFEEALRPTNTVISPDALSRHTDMEPVVQLTAATSVERGKNTRMGEEPHTLQDETHHESKTLVSQSLMNSETASSEKTEASKDVIQNDNGQRLHEDVPRNTKSLVLDLEVDDDDELPSVPPPPIPDLPPPPDDLPMDSDTEDNVHETNKEEQAAVEAVTNTKSDQKTMKSMTKSSFRTIRKKEEWTRKSEALDSSMFEPLPLLVSSKTTKSRLPDPLPEGDESSGHMKYTTSKQTEESNSLTDEDNILHGSSESLPSLPESPPPQLPDGPPPDLATSFPPEFESDITEEGVVISETLLIATVDDVADESENVASSIPTIDIGAPIITGAKPSHTPITSPDFMPPLRNEQSTKMDSYEVQFQKPKRETNGASPRIVNSRKRSAFDALCAVEPSAEEKSEPKLSTEQRRSLALEASRRSNADTSPFLERWNRGSSPSSEPEMKQTKGNRDTSIPNNDKDREKSDKQEMSPDNKHIAVDTTSQVTQAGQELKLLPTEGHGLVRPCSVVGVDDFQLKVRSSKDNESRWSLPPDSGILHTVGVASEGESPSLISLDHKLTSTTIEKWKNTPCITVNDNLLSASTGQLFGRSADQSLESGDRNAGKDISWYSLNSSSESLPPFVGLKKSPRQTQGISPLAATFSVASTSTPREESFPETDNNESTEVQASQQQIFYAQKQEVQSRASERKRKTLTLGDDDQVAVPLETHKDRQVISVPLRRKNLQNLRLSSLKTDYLRVLDSPRPASLVLDRDILKVHVSIPIESLA